MPGFFSTLLSAVRVVRGSVSKDAPREDRNLARFFWIILGLFVIAFFIFALVLIIQAAI